MGKGSKCSTRKAKTQGRRSDNTRGKSRENKKEEPARKSPAINNIRQRQQSKKGEEKEPYGRRGSRMKKWEKNEEEHA